MAEIAVLTRQLLSFVPSAALAFWTNAKFGVSQRLLEGTRCYFAAEQLPSGARGRPVAPRSSRKHKKTDEDSVDLGGAENLVVTSLRARDLVIQKFYPQLDTLVFMLLLPLYNVLIGEIMVNFDRPVDHMALGLCALALGYSVLALLRVDVLSTYTSGADRVYSAACGVVAFVVALAALALLPPWLVGFDPEGGAATLGPAFTEVIRSRAEHLKDVPEVKVPAAAVQLALASLAGLLAAVLFSPCLRFVRAYWLQHNAPEWAGEYIAGGPVVALRFNLHLLLPFAVLLLWVKPVTEVLALAPHELALLQAAVLLLTALVQAFNLRPLVQRYSDTSLTGWHQIKHGLVAGSKKEQRAAAGEVIRAKCRVTYALLAKAAVQALAPAGLFLGLGLLQLYTTLHPLLPAGGPDANGMLQSWVGFLASWAAACWALFCSLDLWLFRTGTLQN